MDNPKLIAAVSAILLSAGGIYYYASDKGETVDLSNEIVYIESEEDVESTGTIVVYITGAVKNPGVFDIPENSRVLDAVNAAGGVTNSADLESINMAQKVKDGQHVTVPEISLNSTDNQVTNKKSTSKQNSLVNINTADESELTSLPGVGPATAKKIIDYRENNGAFVEIEDIKKVRGIGHAKFENMKDLITT